MFGGIRLGSRRLSKYRTPLFAIASSIALAAIAFTAGGCGGSGSGLQPNRGTDTIQITAQSGTVAHSTAVSITIQ